MGNCLQKIMNENLKISVVIPAFNMERTIKETILSVLNQTYDNFEIIVQDNDSTDNTMGIAKSFSDPRVKYFKNRENVGYAKNLIEGWKNCTGDILYFLGADDILSKHALRESHDAFMLNDDIGAVTRPYFWFQSDINSPVRVTPFLNDKKNETINIQESEKAVCAMHNEILGQLSGLSFRNKYLKESFFTRENDWIAHGYPFVNIFKNHPVVFLKNYQVAVRIGVNAIRKKGSTLYAISPTKRWVDMLNEVLKEKDYWEFKDYFIKKVIAANYIGLVQIKCYSHFKFLLREIWYLIKNKRSNLFNFKFWFFSLGCIIIPRAILAKMTDWYKSKINSKLIYKNNFQYDISNNEK